MYVSKLANRRDECASRKKRCGVGWGFKKASASKCVCEDVQNEFAATVFIATRFHKCKFILSRPAGGGSARSGQQADCRARSRPVRSHGLRFCRCFRFRRETWILGEGRSRSDFQFLCHRRHRVRRNRTWWSLSRRGRCNRYGSRYYFCI